jgi:two-component system OmpR family sensor kinase
MRTSRPRRAQLSTRVLAGVLLVTVIVLAAFDVAAVTALRRYLLSQTDSRLESVLTLARPWPGQPGSVRGFVISGPVARQSGSQVPAAKRVQDRPGYKQVYVPPILNQYGVVFVSGHGAPKVLLRGPGLPPKGAVGGPALAAAAQRARNQRARNVTVTASRGPHQFRLLAVAADGGNLVATTSLGQVNSTVGRLALIVAVGSAAAAVLVGLGVAWVARRGLRPIETMAAQADRITAGDLTDRVSPHHPRSEVGRLGTALNGMLARIEASVQEREASQELTRRFFADASHELRNPLASLRANAELYQQGALSGRPQVDEAMDRIAAEARRMSGLVDDMLRLARLDQHPGQNYDPVDITGLVEECVERARVTDPRRTWQAHVAPDLMITGDEELLRRAIDNLLANVHAHTPGDTVATIAATGQGSTVMIEVSDDGPGVPAGQLPRIFERFYRAGPQSRRTGSGLGLAVVTVIATAHDGTAEAALNHPNGLRITLTLPARSQACAAGRGKIS